MVDGIHADNVTEWFVKNIPNISLPLNFELVAGGRSNITFKVIDANQQGFVLRRPPLGYLLESAHDMGREYKIISSLGATDIPVAPVLGLCNDKSVNGVNFYVMRFVSGTVYADSIDAETIPVDRRKPLGFEIIDILVRLHKINPDDVGLGDLGKKEDYVARQIRRWTKQWENSKIEEVAEMDEVCRLLKENVPLQIGTSIVHGDYRMGNLIIHNDRVVAVLDWELCTLGDPLADVGFLLNWWYTADEVELGKGDQAPTALGGFPNRDELIAYYEKATGRDLSHINYYRALSYWRLAAITQGVYRRYLEGVMGAANNFEPSYFKGRLCRLAKAALNLLT